MALTVILGRYTIHDVERGGDVASAMAIELARVVVKWQGEYVTSAVVDRENGLAVFNGEPDKPAFGHGSIRGFHFNAALCGYGGEGPSASATILEMFGFGNRQDIFEQIRHGEAQAWYHFRKGEGLIDSYRH